MSVAGFIKANPAIKKCAHWALISPNQYRPRWWVRTFLNPFIHERKKGSIVRWRTKMDLFPYNKFSLGRKSVIEDFTTINNGVGDIIIGNETFIGLSNVIIGPVEIGDHVMTAQNVVISGMNHGYQDLDTPPTKQPVTTEKIVLADNVWIGANSIITSGVKIGKHAVVGAGSVVTRDVPAYSVVAGNPARLIKQYNHKSKSWERCEQ